MKANVGDWLVLKGSAVDRPEQRGLIMEVRSAAGSPPTWCAGSTTATSRPFTPVQTRWSSRRPNSGPPTNGRTGG